MGELIIGIIEKLTSVELVASLVAVLVAVQGGIRLLGEFFISLGEFGQFADDEDWMDSVGSFLRNLATSVGTGLSWFGIGNKK